MGNPESQRKGVQIVASAGREGEVCVCSGIEDVVKVVNFVRKGYFRVKLTVRLSVYIRYWVPVL
jgi:hypothetical protein